jgi:hypothetical protein
MTKYSVERSEQPTENIQARIAHRAYEIYLSRGAESGHDLDDWLQAESEITEA